MSYDQKKVKFGKEAVSIIELFLPVCSRTYGTAPCTAAIGVTGTKKCFNTFATCQDSGNYSPTDAVYRFSSRRIEGDVLPSVSLLTEDGDELDTEDSDALLVEGVFGPPPVPPFPTIVNVTTAPVVLTPGNGLGVRASLSVTLVDHPWTDSGFDPYADSRTYIPDNQGSFWGKFLARQKYYQNKRIDVLTGFLNDDGTYDADNFKRRTYVLTKISGPDASGMVKIEAKDPLRLADNEKFKWPRATSAVLTSDMSSSSTSFVIPTDSYQHEWWNGHAAGDRYIKIEEEVMRVTSVANDPYDHTSSFTVVRASMPAWYDFSQNIAVAHESGATIQLCWCFNYAKVYDIVYLLLSKSGVPLEYLPLDTWTAEIENGFPYMVYSTLLTEPVGVKDLLVELTQHSLLLWWDERSAEIKMKGLRFSQLLGGELTDSNALIAESIAVTEDVKNLATEVWLYMDVIWPLAILSQLRSYRVVDVRANLALESSYAYNQKAIKEIRSRWLPRSSVGMAVEISSVLLRQYSEVRKVVQVDVDPKNDTRWVGDIVGVSTRYVQDDEGAPTPRNYLITQAEEVWTEAGLKIRYVMTEQFNFTRVGLITPDNDPEVPANPMPDYTAAPETLRSRYAFICYDSGKFLDGTNAYQIV